MTMRLFITVTFVFTVVGMLAGCDGSAAKPTSTSGAVIPASHFIVGDKPANAPMLTEVKAESKVGDKVMFEARVGGRSEVFVKDVAIFMAADPRLVSCDQRPGDHCSVPWDYCCEDSNLMKAGTATINLTADVADEHVFVRPGSDAYFLFSIAHVLFEDDLVRLGRFADFTHGVEAIRELAADFAPEATARATGIDADTTRRIAHELADHPRACVYGRIGTCTVEFGTLASWLVDVVNILLGRYDEPGGMMFPRPATGQHEPGNPMPPIPIGPYKTAARGLPTRYILLDSWWYTKGSGGGVKEWDATSGTFPSGLLKFREAVGGMPFQMHNRHWSADNVYATQNGGGYQFELDPFTGLAVPLEQRFWDDLISNKTGAGLAVFEQDWMYNELQGNNRTLQNVSMGREWLLQMGRGAAKHGPLPLPLSLAGSPPHSLLVSSLPQA